MYGVYLCVTIGGMKTCTKCNESKPVEAFRLNTESSDGYAWWCRSCQNKAAELSKRKNKEAYRAKERAKYARRKAKEKGEGYQVGNPENRANPKGNALDPELKRIRHNVRRVTRRAVASGKLVKTPCHVCGEVQVEGHHPDYSRPLDVVWLCRKHHNEVHHS